MPELLEPVRDEDRERGADVVERDGRTFAVWERARRVRLIDYPRRPA